MNDHSSLLIFVLFLTNFLSLSAQNSTNSIGGDMEGVGGSAAYTIGQIDYTYENGIGGNISQGVQQSFEIFLVDVVDIDSKVSLNVFPNPTADYLNLIFEDNTIKNAKVDLYDIQGRLLFQKMISSATTDLDLAFLSAGTYILKVSNDQEEMNTFKIVKN